MGEIMHGLVSLLDQKHYNIVEKIWGDLESKFGLTGIKVTPFPHFSWQIADNYNFDDLDNKMNSLSKEIKPFTVKTAGLGIFTGDSPVIFITVLKDLNLIRLHERIWEIFYPMGDGVSQYYHPENWTPHISLAYSDVDLSNIGDITKFLSFKNLFWEISIDNFALIFEPKGTIGQIMYKFDFVE